MTIIPIVTLEGKSGCNVFCTGEKIHITKKYLRVRGTLTQEYSFQESGDDT